MIHGSLAHGSVVFFFHRVAGYRQALGRTESPLTSLIGYPASFIRAEPELATVAVALLALAWRGEGVRIERFARLAASLGAVFAFLVVGRVLGGAPTHHDERPLLPIFWGLAVVVSACVFDMRGRLLPAMVGALACGLLLRFLLSGTPGAGGREQFSDRSAELVIGEQAKRRIGPSNRMLVETGDYGYFAVIAAFGAPERAEPFERHDPRDAPGPDAFVSADALRSKLAASNASWFVAPQDKVAAGAAGTPVAWSDRLALFHVESLP
jgi:hypothetical protein